jgi:HD superfamily phosphohydrolase YqeK
MRLTDSSHDILKTNPEREMGRYFTNPEATKVSDEEYQEAHWSSVVGRISARNVKYSKVLETVRQMVILIVTLTPLIRLCKGFD